MQGHALKLVHVNFPNRKTSNNVARNNESVASFSNLMLIVKIREHWHISGDCCLPHSPGQFGEPGRDSSEHGVDQITHDESEHSHGTFPDDHAALARLSRKESGYDFLTRKACELFCRLEQVPRSSGNSNGFDSQLPELRGACSCLL
jgi:hypothetical protein